MNWKQEQEALENAFAKRLLVDYNIKEVTTQRQAKNGTREFEFPVTTYSSKHSYYAKHVSNLPKDKLRLACFKSGYVRKQNGTYSPYQLNPTYKRVKKWVFLTDNKLETRKYTTRSRAKIYSGIARLNYMLEYYTRNYAK